MYLYLSISCIYICIVYGEKEYNHREKNGEWNIMSEKRSSYLIATISLVAVAS